MRLTKTWTLGLYGLLGISQGRDQGNNNRILGHTSLQLYNDFLRELRGPSTNIVEA